MPVNIKIVQPKDFIRTTVEGAVDLTISRKILLDITSIIESPGTYHVLIDTRQAQVSLSTTDLYELGVDVASRFTVARNKTAILAPMGDEERAEFLALVAQNRGARLRVFTSFEEAINWLVLEDERSHNPA